jgi:hypothetical protein
MSELQQKKAMTQQEQQRPTTDYILRQAISISPSSINWYSFSVPSSSTYAILEGSYQTDYYMQEQQTYTNLTFFIADSSLCLPQMGTGNYQAACTSYIVNENKPYSYVRVSLEPGKTYDIGFVNTYSDLVLGAEVELFLEHN